MDLTKSQFERLETEMVSVLGEYRHLKRFMRAKLGFRVRRDVDATNLADAVFEVIEKFEPDNREETDLRRLIVALCDEFPANDAFKELASELGLGKAEFQRVRFEMSEGHDEKSSSQPNANRIEERLRSESQGQHISRARLPAGLDEGTNPSAGSDRIRKATQQGSQGSPPKKLDDVSQRKIAEMISALNTLERLREEFDRALKGFITTHAEGIQPDLIDGVGADETLNHVRYHEEMIQLADDPLEVRRILSQLLIDVQAAIEIAERERRFDVVRDLSKAAGNSCLRAARDASDDEKMVLMSVVPYWRMREAYADHQPKIPSRAR